MLAVIVPCSGVTVVPLFVVGVVTLVLDPPQALAAISIATVAINLFMATENTTDHVADEPAHIETVRIDRAPPAAYATLDP
jgi:hypothetical protein